MVTDNHYRWDFIQLSTDVKPTPATSNKVTDGSTLYTSDDSKLYIWYKDQWYEKEATGGGSSYTAGDGIDITDNEISVDTTTIQEKLTAGTGIDITDNTISVTGGGGPTVVQSTGTSTTDVMSQNATTKLVYPDPSNVSSGNISIRGITTSNVRAQVAIGDVAQTKHFGNVALGVSADARGLGSVALGPFSKTTQQGQVDISTLAATNTYGYNNSQYRLLTGLYDPQSDHDAATKGYVDSLISALEARIAALEGN